MRLGWKVHMTYQHLMIFLTNEIQAQKHRWKCVVHKEDYIENKPHLATFCESILVSPWSFQTTHVYYHSLHIYKHKYEDGLKSSYDDVISTVDNIFNQWDSNTATYEKSVWTTKGTMLKNKPHLATFWDSILVSLWTTFQPTLIISNNYVPIYTYWYLLSCTNVHMKLWYNLIVHISRLCVIGCICSISG